MALLDELRKRMTQQKPLVQQDVQGQLQKLATAKTGKAAPMVAAPVASSLGQQQAQGDVAAQATQQQLQANLQQQALSEAAGQQSTELAQLRQRIENETKLAEQQMAAKGAMAREALTGQETRTKNILSSQERQKLTGMSSNYKNNLNKMATDNKIAVDDIFANFAQDTKELEFRKDGAQLEQIAHNMAMANDKYLQELSSIWAVRDLENELSFNKESANMAYGNTVLDVLGKIGYQELANADDRTFNEMLGRLNIDQALAVGNAQIAQAQASMIVSGVAQGAQTYIANRPKPT